jgi:hypothetical protein
MPAAADSPRRHAGQSVVETLGGVLGGVGLGTTPVDGGVVPRCVGLGVTGDGVRSGAVCSGVDGWGVVGLLVRGGSVGVGEA